MASQRITGPTMEDIMKDVKAGNVSPVYTLTGEEPFYIDRISQFLVDQLMPEMNRDFDFDLHYGLETDCNRITDSCRQFPMLGERRVVLVREAQQIRGGMDGLEGYLRTPNETTVLILCYKDKLDGRKAVTKLFPQAGVLFEGKRVYESALPGFISGQLRIKGVEIEAKASEMLVDHIGTDLTRMAAELDKLVLSLPAGEKRVSAQLVEDLTGMSKDFNNFELLAALSKKDNSQAMKIVKYFNANPKSFSLQVTLSQMFTFYADLMQAYYAPEKTERGIAGWIGKPDWKVRNEIIPAMRCYSGTRVMQILSEIRRTDAASKGVGGCRTAPGDLLLELIYSILN